MREQEDATNTDKLGDQGHVAKRSQSTPNLIHAIEPFELGEIGAR
jgi:hypothetical protein